MGQQSIAGAGSTTEFSTFSPYLELVPGDDGRQVFISVSGFSEPCETVFVNLFDIKVEDVPTGFKESYSLLASDQVCVTTAGNFPERKSLHGKVSITTTYGLETEPLEFRRAYVPASTTQTIRSVDGSLELTLVSTDTIRSDTYIAIMPNYAPPGSAPQAHRFASNVYSVRAAGALLVTAKPMGLRLYYNAAILSGADPHTLSIFVWDAAYQRWNPLDGRLFFDQHYVSVATSRFTTYALMATPAWSDEFDDFNGLDAATLDNVTLGGSLADRALVLGRTPGDGTAVSKPITPPAGIDSWGNVSFTSETNPPNTNLTVDILSADGTALLTDIASGADLAGIDPVQHPALRLRVNLSSTIAGETPALHAWRITWETREHDVYLPVVRRGHP